MPADYEHISWDCRIDSIGAILSKGVSLSRTRELESEALNARSNLKSREGGMCLSERIRLSPDGARILEYLNRVGPSTPTEIQRFVAISKATTFKRLRELMSAGVVDKSGENKKVRYAVVSRVGVCEPNELIRDAEKVSVASR